MMAIIIFIGNVGSAKTSSAVRYMCNTKQIKTYTNIITSLPNTVTIDSSMIIENKIVGYKNKRNGEKEAITQKKLNKKFWQEIDEPINVIIDEAHTIMNPRRAMSKINIIMSDFMALLRRVLGNSPKGMGDLILITQLPRRLDPIARDMAHQIRFHRCYYTKYCKCGWAINECNEDPEQVDFCFHCGSYDLKRKDFKIEVFHFNSFAAFTDWDETGSKSFYRHYIIEDIEKYFKYYNTLQWDNLISEY